MVKTISMLALSALAVGAFAQTGMRNWAGNPIDPNTMSYDQARMVVMNQADNNLKAGDAYVLSELLDHGPTDVANAVVMGLARANYQANVIGDEILTARYPWGSTSYTTTVTNPDGTVTTTTTTTSTPVVTEEFAMTSRPMRLVMERGDNMVNYNEAEDIVSSNLTTPEATIFHSWWRNTASEAQKDAIVRMLKDNASIGTGIYYPSVGNRWSNWHSIWAQPTR